MAETWSDSNAFFGSGNVFVDLGFPDAEELTTKVLDSGPGTELLRCRMAL